MNSFDDKLIRNCQLSEAEQQELLVKLWELLKWQAGKYNGIDSTSMPIEKAQDLLASLLYTLSVAASEDGIPMESLLQKDFHSVIHRGQEILDHKRKSVKILWKDMCIAAPHIPNYYYIETIRNIGLFFKRYEIYYEAHQIPCSLDYPLLNSVADDLKGISFVEEYIHRLMIENEFINKFDIQAVIRLLKSRIPDYRETYFNLSESVLRNAMGRKLLGQEIHTLDISAAQQAELLAMLKGKTLEEYAVLMDDAVYSMCREMNITDRQAIRYFQQAANEANVRIYSAVKSGNISHIFVSFLPDGILPAEFETFGDFNWKV